MRCPKCGGDVNNGKCIFCGFKVDDSVNPFANKSVNGTQPMKSSADIYEKNVAGVAIVNFYIRTEEGMYSGSGSGCLITRDGYVLTNTHVIYAEDFDLFLDKVEVTIDNKKYVGRVLKHVSKEERGGPNDVALIKIDGTTFNKVLQIGDSNKLRMGDEVTAIGNALGFGINVTRGVISDLHKRYFNEEFLTSDVGINQGNSGGPLFNSDGQLIAICVSSPVAEAVQVERIENMNFFIPINHVLDMCRNWGYKF